MADARISPDPTEELSFVKKGFRCTIGSGRKFQIRGAPSEKQTEPDEVGGRSGWKDDWIPLSDAGGFSLALKVLWGSAEILMEFLHHVRPGKHDAQTCSLLNIRSSAAGRMEQLHCGRSYWQVAPAVHQMTFLHSPSNWPAILCSDLVGAKVAAAYSK